MKNVKLLSLDTSSTKSGWSVFDNGKYIKSGVIDLSKYKDSMERVDQMCLALSSKVREIDPDIVVIERLRVSRNMSTVRILSRVIGAMYFMCLEWKIKYHEVDPSHWRSVVGLQNGATCREDAKRASVEYVKKQYGKSVTDDEADAICIGESYIKECKETSK